MVKELILLCGFPAAGKSTIVEEYVKQGYSLISRDITGGGLEPGSKFDTILNDRLKTPGKYDKIILDNIYTTVESRMRPILLGKKYGYSVICAFVNTTFEDAQYNAVSRMIKKHGKLFLSNDEYKNSKDPNAFPVAVLYKARKAFIKPTLAEGFDTIKIIPFKRIHTGYTNKAVIFDYDNTLRNTKSGQPFPTDVNDIEIIPGRIEKLKELKAQGYILLGVSNQSGVAKGLLSYETAEKCFKRTNELLGFDIDFRFCFHSVPPITCYCRKPGVGFGVEFIEKYKLDASQTIMVGDMTSDETFAKRCGFKFKHANTFFN